MGRGGGKDKLAKSGGAILTRRNLLEFAGLTLVATAIPPGGMMAEAAASQGETAQGVSPVMGQAQQVHEARRVPARYRTR